MFALRERFWVPRSRQRVRQVIPTYLREMSGVSCEAAVTAECAASKGEGMRGGSFLAYRSGLGRPSVLQGQR